MTGEPAGQAAAPDFMPADIPALGRADLSLDEWQHLLGRRTGIPGCPCGEPYCPPIRLGPTAAEARYILGLRGWEPSGE